MTAIDRRTLLVAGGAGVGLIVAWALWPKRIGSALSAAKDERVFGHYLKIGLDGRVTVAVPQAETGQGIWTGLAQVAADELGAAWEQVAVEPAPASPVYANNLLGGRMTAGATSIRAFEAPIRQAAATARDLLVRAAADRWGVDAAECTIAGGSISHEGKRLGFGEVAAEAAGLAPNEQAPLRPAGSGRLAGQPLPRLDLPPKSDGTMRFAADVRLPNMLFASARLAPPGGRLTGFSRQAAERVNGVRGVVVTNGWLAVLADTWWTAETALRQARPRFTGPSDAGDEAIDAALDEAMASGSATSLVDVGDYEGTVGSARALAATYRIAPAQHLALEPLGATARLRSGELEVWAPVQSFDAAHRAAADAAGLGLGRVTLYPAAVGSGTGRAADADAIPIAVELARRSGRPVQLTIPAAASQSHDRLRPPLVARMAALPSPDGSLGAWSARFVTMGELAGAAPPYAIPNQRIDLVAADLPIRTGYMRGGSEALAAFANECFVDEMARALDRETFAFRMGLLGGNPRLARVLTTATALGGWDGGAPGSTMGLACASAFGSHIALLAEAGFGPGQSVQVSRLVAAVDCGRAINPNLVRQQIEGSLLQALALATAPAPGFVAGLPKARPASAMAPQRLGGLPDIQVEIVGGREEPGGVSGLGHLVLPAAVANAIASGTGRRLRNLPFDPMAG